MEEILRERTEEYIIQLSKRNKKNQGPIILMI